MSNTFNHNKNLPASLAGHHISVEECFNRMESINKYFGHNIPNNHSFEPEHKASSMINKMIRESAVLTAEHVSAMLCILNEVEDGEHFNGSGWLDYKMNFKGLMNLIGFPLQTEESGKLHLDKTY